MPGRRGRMDWTEVSKMSSRAKKRKIAKLAVEAGMQDRKYWAVLEDAISACPNKKTRAQLRSRILRGK